MDNPTKLGYKGVSSGEAKLTQIFTKIEVFSPSSSNPQLCYGSYSTKARPGSFRDYNTSRLQTVIFELPFKGFVKKIIWTAKA
ncbi:hypothetical protein Tco_1007902 [Tanacetum coccineum]